MLDPLDRMTLFLSAIQHFQTTTNCAYTDESRDWNMVCGRCWKDVSGGVVDGDIAHPFYRYGGLWKNRTVK